jgi:hypothetical protein
MKSLIVTLLLLLPLAVFAQRGDIVIPKTASITVPNGAQICADRIYANNTGYGTLSLASKTCLCSGAVVIPVELIALSATLAQGTVILSWVTATETLNYGFEVQRHDEGDGWTTLGFIDGHGTTTATHSYTFTDGLADLPAYCCELRYRLRQIDVDGRTAFSPVVEVRLDAPLPQFALEAFPSPCDAELTVRFTLRETAAVRVRLLDLAGRLIRDLSTGTGFPAGWHTLQAPMVDLPSGQYLLVLDAGMERHTEKVVVRH